MHAMQTLSISRSIVNAFSNFHFYSSPILKSTTDEAKVIGRDGGGVIGGGENEGGERRERLAREGGEGRTARDYSSKKNSDFEF